MREIDKSKPVMVTGANGYIASWLVKRLLNDSITVHAISNSAIHAGNINDPLNKK